MGLSYWPLGRRAARNENWPHALAAQSWVGSAQNITCRATAAAIQLEREGSPLPRLRLPRAKLTRKPNQVARGRIRRFESDMPRHAVRLGGSVLMRVLLRDTRGERMRGI
jgi:hypothetical protein